MFVQCISTSLFKLYLEVDYVFPWLQSSIWLTLIIGINRHQSLSCRRSIVVMQTSILRAKSWSSSQISISLSRCTCINRRDFQHNWICIKIQELISNMTRVCWKITMRGIGIFKPSSPLSLGSRLLFRFWFQSETGLGTTRRHCPNIVLNSALSKGLAE